MSKARSVATFGPPVWVWILLVPFTIAVIAGIIMAAIPRDLEEVYQETVASFNLPEGKDTYERNLPLLKADPAYAEKVTYLEGQFALTQRRAPKALKLFAQIPEDSPLKAVAERQSGLAHQEMGDFEEAVAAFRRSLKKDEGDGIPARYSLASMYYAAGAIDLAEKELDENIKIDPDHEPSRVMRARRHAEVENWEAARKDFETVLSSPAKYSVVPPEFVSEYFSCLIGLGDTETLEEVAKEHLSFVSEPIERSRILVELGEVREAMIALTQLQGPDAETPLAQIAKLRRQLADEDVDPEDARLTAMSLLPRAPRELELMQLAAEAFKKAGDDQRYEIAVQNVQKLTAVKEELREAMKAVGSDITNAEGRAEVARLFQKLGNYDGMMKWYSKAVMLDRSFREESMAARSGKGFPVKPLVAFEEEDVVAAESTEESEPKESEKASPEPEGKKEEAAAEKSEPQKKPETDAKPAKDKAEKTDSTPDSAKDSKTEASKAEASDEKTKAEEQTEKSEGSDKPASDKPASDAKPGAKNASSDDA